MKVKDIMTTSIKTAHPENKAYETAKTMKDFDIGMVPVIQDSNVVGVLTDRDISLRVVANGNDPKVVNVGDVMTTDAYYCYEDQDIKELSQVMKEFQVRRVLVYNRDKKLAGICSIGDLAKFDDTGEISSDVLMKVSEPEFNL